MFQVQAYLLDFSRDFHALYDANPDLVSIITHTVPAAVQAVDVLVRRLHRLPSRTRDILLQDALLVSVVTREELSTHIHKDSSVFKR
jgi:hypothetical protein